MTLQELSAYYILRTKIDVARETLQSLEYAAEPGAQAIDGMPHGQGVSDKVGDLAIEIADMRKTIEALEFEAGEALEKITNYIDNIESDFVRVIFRLRFIRCLSWREVASVIGGKNTGNSVKLICYRFLREKS